MPLMYSNLITADANRKLAELTLTGQIDYNFAYNPSERPGADRHVLMLRDTPHDPAPARQNLSTQEFQLLLTGTEPWVFRGVAANRIVKGDVTKAWTAKADAQFGEGDSVQVHVELHCGFGEETITYRDPHTSVSIWLDPARQGV